MTKVYFRYACLGLFLLAAFPLHAQTGCVNSPENPTAILGLIGAAGACYIPLKKKLISILARRQEL
jgi:XrtJ-associated TM-motif-TM protein